MKHGAHLSRHELRQAFAALFASKQLQEAPALSCIKFCIVRDPEAVEKMSARHCAHKSLLAIFAASARLFLGEGIDLRVAFAHPVSVVAATGASSNRGVHKVQSTRIKPWRQ